MFIRSYPAFQSFRDWVERHTTPLCTHDLVPLDECDPGSSKNHRMEKFQVGDDTHDKIPISAASRSRGDAT